MTNGNDGRRSIPNGGTRLYPPPALLDPPAAEDSRSEDLRGERLRKVGGPTPLSERVLAELEHAIAEGRLKPHELYPVAELAKDLGVSRTPVREALLHLVSRDMVKFERSRGVRILELPARDIHDIFELRLFLEPPATWKAADRNPPGVQDLPATFKAMLKAARANDEQQMWRLDRELHLIILRASGNPRLAKYVDTLRDLIFLREATVAALRARNFMDLAEEHHPIVDAVMNRKPDQAAEAMSIHIQHSAEVILGHEELPRVETS